MIGTIIVELYNDYRLYYLYLFDPDREKMCKSTKSKTKSWNCWHVYR